MPVLTTGSKRILYIHVPKTGGSYIEDLMRSYGEVTGVRFGKEFHGLPCSPQHFHRPLIEHLYSTDRREVQHAFDYVFMTVRHPVRRLESEFRYRYPSRFQDRVRRRLGAPTSFGSWASWAIRQYQRNPFLFDNHVRPQAEFQTFDADVFRLEDDLSRVKDTLDRVTGMQGVAPGAATNQSTTASALRLGLSGKAEHNLREFYAADFQRFGYDWISTIVSPTNLD